MEVCALRDTSREDDLGRLRANLSSCCLSSFLTSKTTWDFWGIGWDGAGLAGCEWFIKTVGAMVGSGVSSITTSSLTWSSNV